MVEEIQELYAYNRWANHRTLEVTGGLSPGQLGRDLGSSFPSVHDTLAHMLGAEWMWLERWKGTSPTAMPAWDVATHETLRARWSEVEAEQTEFVANLTPERLRAEVSYRNTQGAAYSDPLGGLMRHVVNHASYHRGQVAAMLRQLGVEPVSTDLVRFYRERRAAD